MRARRKIAGLATVVGFAVGSLAAAQPAAAGGCIGVFCGRVSNYTGFTLHYTTDLGSKKAKGACDMWNADGDMDPKWQNMKCTQKKLKGISAGGKDANGKYVDVDAFTFNYTYYWYRVGDLPYTRFKKGVWTKFHTGMKVVCDSVRQNEPACQMK